MCGSSDLHGYLDTYMCFSHLLYLLSLDAWENISDITLFTILEVLNSAPP